MKLHVMGLIAAVASCVSAGVVAQGIDADGSGLSYTYVDGRFVDFDNDGADGDGLRFRGSYELESNFLVVGSFGMFDFDRADADLTVFSIGGGYYLPYAEGMDLVGTVELIRADIDANGFSDNDTGFGLTAGVRGLILDQLEGRAFANYVDVSDSDIFVSLEADYWINEDISAGIGLDIGGDADEIRLGARWSF